MSFARWTRGVELVAFLVALERNARAADAEPVCFPADPSEVPPRVQLALAVQRIREFRIAGEVSLWTLRLGSPWFVVAARRQERVLLFTESGSLALVGEQREGTMGWRCAHADERA